MSLLLRCSKTSTFGCVKLVIYRHKWYLNGFLLMPYFFPSMYESMELLLITLQIQVSKEFSYQPGLSFACLCLFVSVMDVQRLLLIYLWSGSGRVPVPLHAHQLWLYCFLSIFAASPCADGHLLCLQCILFSIIPTPPPVLNAVCQINSFHGRNLFWRFLFERFKFERNPLSSGRKRMSGAWSSFALVIHLYQKAANLLAFTLWREHLLGNAHNLVVKSCQEYGKPYIMVDSRKQLKEKIRIKNSQAGCCGGTIALRKTFHLEQSDSCPWNPKTRSKNEGLGRSRQKQSSMFAEKHTWIQGRWNSWNTNPNFPTCASIQRQPTGFVGQIVSQFPLTDFVHLFRMVHLPLQTRFAGMPTACVTRSSSSLNTSHATWLRRWRGLIQSSWQWPTQDDASAQPKMMNS